MHRRVANGQGKLNHGQCGFSAGPLTMFRTLQNGKCSQVGTGPCSSEHSVFRSVGKEERGFLTSTYFYTQILLSLSARRQARLPWGVRHWVGPRVT